MPETPSATPSKIESHSSAMDDVLAQALAAVEAREHAADESEMAEFANDLEVDEDGLASEDDVVLAEEPPPEMDFRVLTEEWEQLNQAIEQANAQRDQAIARLAQGKDLVRRLQLERKRLTARAQRHADRARDAEDKVAQLARERDELRKQVEDLRANLSRADGALARAREARARQTAELNTHGQAPALTELLPVFDHLKLAMAHAHTEPERVVSGLNVILGQFEGALARLGVAPIPAEPGGAFDPAIHEAMMEVEADDFPPNTIVEVVHPGYSLHGRMLRAARVSVAQNRPRQRSSSEE